VTREKKAGGPRNACCMVSELLLEAGIDRESVRRVRRQVLEGVILLCRWQLERMERGRERTGERTGEPAAKGRRIRVE
jgi:hypothetical protein